MTSPSSNPVNVPASINLRGAVDLSSLKNPKPAPGAGPASGPAAGTAGGYIQNVTEETFPQLVQLSAEVPVVIDLASPRSAPSQQLSPILEKLANEYAGRFLLATVDTDANPQIAQAFQVQAVPSTMAILKGQPVPLFQGTLPEEQIRSYIDEMLKVAQTNGVTGTLDGAAAEPGAEPAPAPLPPLHQEAFDAIEAGDYAGAAAAYRKALAEQPADHEARTGLAQVQLLQRLDGADPGSLRHRAAEEPESLAAQLDVADLDISGGHVEDAFERLVSFIAAHSGDEREQARARLVELFDIVGGDDPRVTKARSALARALF